MLEEERIREQVARQLCFDDNRDWEQLDFPHAYKKQSAYYRRADQILSLKGIEIKSDDQSYPEIPRKDIVHIIMERDTVLREAGFIKVAPKPNV